MSSGLRRGLWTGTAAVAVTVGSLLIGAGIYSDAQLRRLAGQPTYASPEKGLRAQIAEWYSGVERVEIAHAGREPFDDLWFVEARVRAARRNDGKGPGPQGWHNPGGLYLRVQTGWVHVPEGRFPEVIALGKWMFSL